ncbi:MAG TPA: PP2C family protein-serine/threonine phosphatase [Armatimonadota bacterium]|nr:PP2C family protein-serine/threonine phosphatase [Armatimonadota bacterium]
MAPANTSQMMPDPALLRLGDYLAAHAEEIVRRTERVWESSILLFAELDDEQRARIRWLAVQTLGVWNLRLRQDSSYARQVHELGQQWGEQAARWSLHIYSFTRALELLIQTLWEYIAETYPLEQLSPAAVFFIGRLRDQVIENISVPLLSVYLQQREVSMAQTRFTLDSPLTLPGRSLLLELRTRLLATRDRVLPAWVESVRRSAQATESMEGLLAQRGGQLLDLLLSLLQSPTPETGAVSLSTMRQIGLDSAQAGVSFREMFHALQQLRPILWESVYEIYRFEQYWHPAEFIEALARLHLLLDLFSEGIGQAYLQQKEMIIQEQAEALHRRDLSLAREILESLLPQRALTFPTVEIGATWLPSREIGGDFYDVFELDDGDIVLLIGDVSGKGISAALLVSMVKYVLKANAPYHRSPASLFRVANRLFYTDMGPELFVTAFVARYTPSTGRLVYSSAGHDPGYLCRAVAPSRTITLPSQGPALGIFPDITLKDRRVVLSEHDVVFLYTDGLVNMRRGGALRMDVQDLCQFVHRHRALPAPAMVQQVVDEVTASCEATDDITALVLKRRAGGTRD